MSHVDRTKHDFDILEHVLGGVKAAAERYSPDVITFDAELPVGDSQAPPLEIIVQRARIPRRDATDARGLRTAPAQQEPA